MEYISEQIINLDDFEKLIDELYIAIQLGALDKLLKLVEDLKNFEFEIEKRKVSYRE